uniref:Uncharacterized protein n=1 Tax=Anguilla anguilla TaxID=7936 RepID=A0A0E9QKL1_ANGAN
MNVISSLLTQDKLANLLQI